ncbi:unnamed protein product [Calypogeia fissa]
MEFRHGLESRTPELQARRTRSGGSGGASSRGFRMKGLKIFLSLPTLLLMMALTLSTGQSVVRAQLLVDYYASSCPRAESIVTAAVQAATAADQVMPAKLVRLLFHDCFVNGCDGSILIDPSANNTSPEKTDPANASVDGYAVIDAAKATLETVCPGTVSCADIVALAAQDAVLLTGGPPVRVPTGRRDGLVSLASQVQGSVPLPTSDLTTMLAMFQKNGLNINDLVILAGAHTIGTAHCSSINNRITYAANGSVIVDPTLAPTFAQKLMSACPQSAPATDTVPIDPFTPLTFDTQYYVGLQDGEGLLTSDEVLFTDPRTRNLINTFATNQVVFFENWGPSFVAMGGIQVLTGTSGEIRTNCRKFNNG